VLDRILEHQQGIKIMLTGLALVGKAATYAFKHDFSIHHHEVLIEF
jgi:hypothetical protein